MTSKYYRLDRFISQNSMYKRSDVRRLVAQKRILLDGVFAQSASQVVGPFVRVCLEGVVLQGSAPVYLMLNKPRGVVSATRDSHHKTVLDLIEHTEKSALHIVGRLDFNTTGLILLTNDGKWSRALSLPESKWVKTYHVTLANPVTDQYAEVFRRGIDFKYEGIRTQPATIERLTENTVKLHLVEGKYHQVKRMFGYFQNKVIALHRISVGGIVLDRALAAGESRALSAGEIQGVVQA